LFYGLLKTQAGRPSMAFTGLLISNCENQTCARAAIFGHIPQNQLLCGRHSHARRAGRIL
jgi:hypothetical protein